MCKPDLFMGFAQWMQQTVIPKCLTIPEMFRDAHYGQGALQPSALVALWGRPYYPLAPFVLERFTLQYFRNHKTLLIPKALLERRIVDIFEPYIGLRACEVIEEQKIEVIVLLALLLYVILHYFGVM